MPHYDYRCQDCGRRARLFFTYAEYDKADPHCPHCAGRLQRRIGRVAIARGDDARTDDLLDDALLGALDADDPRALGRMMRRMSEETGEPLDAELGEVVDRLEKGQSADEIEAALPDLDGGDAL